MRWDEKEQAKKIREEYNIKYNNYMTLNLEQLNLCEDKETNASDFECESRTFADRIIVGKDRKRFAVKNSYFEYINFRKFECEETVFINCFFKGVKFIDCDVPNIKFINCNFDDFEIVRSNFIGSIFSGCLFIRSRVEESTLDESIFPLSNYYDIEIDTDKSKPNYSTVKGVLASEQKEVSSIETILKSDEVVPIEVETIENKIYKHETIVIEELKNNKFVKCEFIECVFENDKETDNYINDLSIEFWNSNFKKCLFNATFFKTVFDGSNFLECRFKDKYIRCSFCDTVWNKNILEDTAVFNYSMIINAVLDFDFTSIPERNRKNVGIGTTANSKNIVNNLSEKDRQIEQLNKENKLLK